MIAVVSSRPSSLPTLVPLGRARAVTTGAMLIVLAASLVQIVRANRACQSDFTYARDEAYVHLVLARQMAMPAGGQPWPAAAALAESASPAWTSLLAGIIRLSGAAPATDDPAEHGRVERLAPLVLNLVMAALLVMLVGHALRFDVHSSSGLLGRLLVVAGCTAIPLLVLTGTEHLAHAFVLLLAVSAGVELIERERLAAWQLLSSAAWIALAVGLRYESLAVVGGIVLWGWIRRRLRRVILPALAGAGVAVGIAIYLGTHGQSWLPLPVKIRLLEGVRPPSEWGLLVADRAVANIREALLPAALVMIAAVMLWSRREQQSSPDAEDRIRVGWLAVFLVAGVIHLLIARTGEHFRHTAYLVPLGAVAILRALANRPGAKWAPSAPVGLRYAVLAVFCLLPLAAAALPVLQAVWNAPQACRQVYLKNRMMAAFVRTYFPNATVVSNAVGALRYETKAEVLDFLNPRVRSGFESGEALARLVLLAGREGQVLPRQAPWVHVARWEADDWEVAVGCREERVRETQDALALFAHRQLPPGVSMVPPLAPPPDVLPDSRPATGPERTF